MLPLTPRVVLFGLTLLALLALGACGSGSRSNATSASSKPNTFTLSEFTIVPPDQALHAGSVTITADNVGGETHELVIVASKASADLPMKSDGSVDEDRIPDAQKVGEISDVPAHTTRSKTFDLKPGAYVAFCNVIDSIGSGMMGGTSSGMMGGGSSGMMGGTTPMPHGGHVHYALGIDRKSVV